MSTNYYLKNLSVCPHCGSDLASAPEADPADGLHLGKSSAGWCFALRVYPEGEGEHVIKDLVDWIPLFIKFGVVDEYGSDISTEGMIRIITERKHPNGLRRHEVERGRCLGPGEGSWDLMIGEFS